MSIRTISLTFARCLMMKRLHPFAIDLKSTLLGVLALMCLTLSPMEVLGQGKFDRSKEMGLMLGTSYYMGDLNPGGHFGGRKHVAFGGFLRSNLSRRISLRGHVMSGTVEAWDADSPVLWQQNRNLHFRNQITEVGGVVEINYIDYQIGTPSTKVCAYLLAGIGIYNHMPEAINDGTWFELATLGTEGQGTSWGEAYGIGQYSLTGLALPFGFGFKVNLGPFAGFNLEWAMRKTWNDYIDDVSGIYADPLVLNEEQGELSVILADQSLSSPGDLQDNTGLMRGDPGRDDAYGFVTASITFRVGKKPTTCWN